MERVEMFHLLTFGTSFVASRRPDAGEPVDDIPSGAFSFEPKWDGFRSIVFRDGDEIEIGSRNGRLMTRYFPEVVEANRDGVYEVHDGYLLFEDLNPRRGLAEMPTP